MLSICPVYNFVVCYRINPLPFDNFFDHTKLKAFADDKLTATIIRISVFDGIENIVGKGENAVTSKKFIC